ncbi:sensor histidine kinase [Deinococcus peraridilitoris]|uniref:histidine kinase n=1 Tax=Deinococcus peraridilitoris (strain DSM 19664 / LMG 22246 / CIP 109416 / KR-200) TaxID=937777 RepID=L0A0A1_DEIPD|nr:HAMP domain-containing sensor histidine kinase [Deinococcus peraridilitoris]AFZ67318.1 signal transduction histidine kinase [Deinococcus peraridilitoris DSM 19664]
MPPTFPEASRVMRKPIQPGSLRAQFALVIALLSFLPNIVIVLVLARLTGLTDFTLILAWMGVVALASGGVGYALSLALLRPLIRLTGEVERGHLGEPHADDPREVISLRAAFASLLGRLAQEQGRRNAFMATLVHDLKTPLIATSHLVAVLRGVGLPQLEREEIAGQLLGENARLLQLVQQMADAHKFEREGVTLHRAPLDLHALGERLLSRFRVRAAERSVTLQLGGAGTSVADEAQLDRALSNLLDNAVRYAESAVWLQVERDRLCVWDDGPGLVLPLSELAQPFNAQPVEIAGHHYTAGTAGLGLFIVRRIAEAHGGDLRYRRETREYGQTLREWSVFELYLGRASSDLPDLPHAILASQSAPPEGA